MVVCLVPSADGLHAFGGSRWRVSARSDSGGVRPYEIATVDLRDPAVGLGLLGVSGFPLLAHLQVVRSEAWVQRYRIVGDDAVEWLEGDCRSGEELVPFPLDRPLPPLRLAAVQSAGDAELFGGERFVRIGGKPVSVGAAVSYACVCGKPATLVAQVGYGDWKLSTGTYSFYPGEQAERFYWCAVCEVVGVVTDAA